jgi:hypothetical protein
MGSILARLSVRVRGQLAGGVEERCDLAIR